jgi:hypothetical protein
MDKLLTIIRYRNVKFGSVTLFYTVKSDLLQLVCIHVEERGEVGDEVSTDLRLLRGLSKFAGLLKQRKDTPSSTK